MKEIAVLTRAAILRGKGQRHQISGNPPKMFTKPPYSL
jgi:hypothetical protein